VRALFVLLVLSLIGYFQGQPENAQAGPLKFQSCPKNHWSEGIQTDSDCRARVAEWPPYADGIGDAGVNEDHANFIGDRKIADILCTRYKNRIDYVIREYCFSGFMLYHFTDIGLCASHRFRKISIISPTIDGLYGYRHYAIHLICRKCRKVADINKRSSNLKCHQVIINYNRRSIRGQIGDIKYIKIYPRALFALHLTELIAHHAALPLGIGGS
jgi:hypothetical protein